MGGFNSIQQSLNWYQSYPVVGSTVFSPVKAVVSTVQIISGLARCVLSEMAAIAAKVTGQHCLSKRLHFIAFKSLKQAGEGLGNLFYACINFGTLGIAGFILESERTKQLINDERRRRELYGWNI